MRSSWHKGKEAQGKARAGTTAPDCTEKCLVKKVSGFGDKDGGKEQKRAASGILRFSWAYFPILRQSPATAGWPNGKPEGLVIHQRQSGGANRLINHCCQDGWRSITDHGKHYACSVGREE
ncbi:hypothetical protein VAWG005_21630 [Aeromonas dhakensis]|nr:hypothetical protein VAWG003_21600 [Aeromonas dhakensis]BEE26235.1 hypothetical protein VAWG005_21630 [Aeromonas dhakensis]